MAISSQPTVLAQSTDAYINAGNTSRLQTFTSSTGAVTINPTNGAFVRIVSPVGSVSVTFTGIPATYGNRWTVEVASRSSNAVTFNNITWDNGVTPTLASGTAKTVLEFYSPDGGSTIYGKTLFASIA